MVPGDGARGHFSPAGTTLQCVSLGPWHTPPPRSQGNGPASDIQWVAGVGWFGVGHGEGSGLEHGDSPPLDKGRGSCRVPAPVTPRPSAWDARPLRFPARKPSNKHVMTAAGSRGCWKRRSSGGRTLSAQTPQLLRLRSTLVPNVKNLTTLECVLGLSDILNTCTQYISIHETGTPPPVFIACVSRSAQSQLGPKGRSQTGNPVRELSSVAATSREGQCQGQRPPPPFPVAAALRSGDPMRGGRFLSRDREGRGERCGRDCSLGGCFLCGVYHLTANARLATDSF